MMGSRRRPLGRSSSGNGSPGSDGEDYGPLADTRPDRRNYLLSIRPEHRSTFCAIIAQLTEETQPLFETTLKSYAVSEDADAKFTCVVTGYPQPEMTWYKDDQEMDRYCGLPKYEIFHHGNRHTLQLYRCTEDDAAIYQASARNSKGIASCSGVLEVGTMSEYRIHQRWFARLKRNAEAKLREIDQSRKRGKENVEMDQLRRRASPDRFQRKRRLTGEIGMQSGASLWDKEEVAKVRIPDGKPRLGEGDPAKSKETPLNPTALFSNNFITGRKEGGVTTNGDASLENGEPNGEENANGFLSYIYEKVEKMKAKPSNKELSSKKKKKKEREGSPPNANQDISQPEGGTQQRKNVLGQKTRSPIGLSQSIPPVANEEQMEAEPKEHPHRVEAEKLVPLLPSTSASDGSYFSLKEMYFDSEGKPESERERPEVKAVTSKANRLKVDKSVPEKTLPETGTALKKVAREERKNESCKEKEGKGKETVQTKSATRPSVETSGDPNTMSSQHPNRPAETVTEAQKPIPPSRLPKAAKAANRSAPRTNVQPLNRTLDARTRVPSPFLKEDRTQLVDGGTRETDLIEPLPADAKPTQQPQRPLRGCREIEKAKPLQGTKQDLQMAVSEGQLDTQGPREPSGNLLPVLSTDKNLQTPASHLRGETNREGKSIRLRRGLHGDTETKGSKETPDPSPETQKVVSTQGQEDNQKTSVASQNLPSVSVDISQPTGKEDLLLKEDEGKHSPVVRNAEVKYKPTPSHRIKELVIHELPSQVVVLEGRPTDRADQVAPKIEEASEEEFVEASQDNRPGLETDLGLEGNRLPTVAARPLVVPDIVETSFPSHIVPEKPTVLLSPTLHGPQAPPQLSPVREGCAERNQSVAHSLTDVKKESGPQSPRRLTGPVPEQTSHSSATEEVYIEEEFVTPPEYEPGALPVSQKAGIQMREREKAISEGHLAPVPSSHLEAAVEEVEESAEQAQHENLVTSLKNYLLLLLKMSTEGEKKKGKLKQEAKAVEEKKPPTAIPKHVTDVGIAGLTPRTSRKIFERVETNQLFQTAESLPLTPRTSRKLTGMINQELLACKDNLVAESEAPVLTCVPSIVVGSASGEMAEHSDQCPGIPSEAVVTLPSATPQELALGARRKIFLPKAKQGEETEGPMGLDDQAPRVKRESPTVSPKQGRRSPVLLATPGPASPPEERRSPTQTRKMATLEVPKMYEEIVEESKEVADDSLVSPENLQGNLSEGQGGESQKANDPFKAPQVIRKIRAEQFSDASGNLKLWCQFFNILSDSKLTWFKDEMPVADVRRSVGDEGQAALAIVQVSKKDCGLYQCTIRNDYGTDTTDFVLTAEVLSGFIFKEEIEAGEEIEMTPMVFAKGLADSGFWGDKLFGRIMVEDLEVGQGFQRKACRARAIYGLEPVFESGHTGIIKVRNLIAFGGRSESTLVEKNYDVTIQECKIQNSSREYCKIFAAEARAVPDFGPVPEITPLYLIYRPANNIPYATMEEDLPGRFERYCGREQDGSSLAPANPSEVGQKCSTFQHWLYQWTNGNILVTDLEGVGWKVTNVRIATKTKGYQGLKESCCPHLLDHFAATHQCNHHCELLALKSLEIQSPAAKVKGSRSPITSRKPSSAQSSPQLQKKGPPSPQASRKGPVSPKSARRCPENTAESPPEAQLKAGEPGRAGQLH